MALLTNPLVVRVSVSAMRFVLGRTPSKATLPEFAGETRSLTIPTRHGDTAATVYFPSGIAGDAPVHINFHGGGYVFGKHDQDAAFCAYLAIHAGVIVVNFDYLLAPENPFPIAVEQSVDAVEWIAANGAAQGWNGEKLTVGGQSAGGGLAAAVSRHAWTVGAPRIALQVLQYPPLDLVTDPARKSVKAGRAIITPPVARIFNAAYVPDPVRAADVLASPAWEGDDADLTGIAPAVIVTPELDRLYDEGVRYAERLRAVGALVEHVDVPDADHGYDLSGKDPALIGRIHDLIARTIKAAHGTD